LLTESGWLIAAQFRLAEGRNWAVAEKVLARTRLMRWGEQQETRVS
jgi:hypothetical protein